MKKSKKLKRSVAYIFIVMLCLTISLIFLVIYETRNNKEKLLWGQSTSDFEVNYKVYNNDNKFYREENLDEYGSFVSSITEKIDFSIKYYFETSKNLNIDYTYNLTGKVLAEVYESGSSLPIWSKNLDINIEEQEKLGNGNYLQLDKKISIPFKEYNDMMIEYKNNYKLNIGSYIKFTITVDIKSLKKINSNISSTDKLTVKIPLLQPTFKIDVNKSVSNNRDIYVSTKLENNKLFLRLGIGGMIVTLIMSLVLFIIYKSTRSKTEVYKDKVNYILKKYEEIIVKIEELPNVEELDIMEITDFNDLIDLEETLKIPIMYININPNKESWFILLHNNFFYRYKVKK